ncbi:uncharacterized protein LOC143244371 isoform X1 [Tachypleus tridentatus]|uniref:uncharacterized protein LOC143244371 isoform X1 n=1 Tax=Tachypleus tridentatus TaxID=6853 RepID=UPI003FD691A2
MSYWMWIFVFSYLSLEGWLIEHVASKSMPRERRLQSHYSSHATDSTSDRPTTTQGHSENHLLNEPESELPRHVQLEPLPSYQQFYRDVYGTQEGVNRLKKKYGPTGLQRATIDHGIHQHIEDIRRANEHFLQIRQMALCHTPRPLVVHIEDYYPDPSKKYLPKCTVLHRCTEDSGCCDNERTKCGPKSVQEVVLYFYTLHIGKQGTYVGSSDAVDKLLFVNHTECECQAINNQPRIQEESDPNLDQDLETSTDLEQHSVLDNPLRHPPSQEDSKCRECPLPFYRREYPDGRCNCDCFDHQKPCLRIKRGRAAMSEIERRCIQSGQCHIPECEYGHFNSSTGECPKRPWNHKRKFNGRKDDNKKRHPYHRWSFYERD